MLIVAHGHILRAFAMRWTDKPLEDTSLILEAGGVGTLRYLFCPWTEWSGTVAVADTRNPVMSTIISTNRLLFSVVVLLLIRSSRLDSLLRWFRVSCRYR